LHNPYCKQAKYALVELCKGNFINAHLTGETSCDRVVAKCLLDDGRDLAAEMMKLELALDIPHFPNADYKHLETPNARRKLRWRPKKMITFCYKKT
jgi:micrococcal nuclease